MLLQLSKLKDNSTFIFLNLNIILNNIIEL